MFDGTLDKWIFIYAVVTAAITEALIQNTPEYINRRRFGAIFSIVIGFATAGIHGVVLEYSMANILCRGLLTVALSNCAYDNLKTILGEIFKMKTPS